MNEAEAANAVATFLREDIQVVTTAYDYPIANTTGQLPDVVSFVVRSRDTADPPDEFPSLNVQEEWWRLFEVICSFMVAVEAQTEEAAEAAWSEVTTMADTIREAIRTDATLRSRLPAGGMASPLVAFNFEEPFIAREGGTEGRSFEMTMLVGERIAAAEGQTDEPFEWPDAS